MKQSFTFQQVRARIAETALKQYHRWEIIDRLEQLGYLPADFARRSNRSLAYRLAWSLLPAGADRSLTCASN